MVEGRGSSQSQPCDAGPHPREDFDAEPSAAGGLDPRYWEVEIRISGESVLVIGHSHLSGIPDIDRYGDVVRTCAAHLSSFIGSGEPEPCFGCGGSGQERWMGLNGEEVGPCSICSDPAESEASSPSEASACTLPPDDPNPSSPSPHQPGGVKR